MKKYLFTCLLSFSFFSILFGQAPLRGEVFDFDIGDQFQSFSTSYDPEYLTITITGKQFSGAGTIVDYDYDWIKYELNAPNYSFDIITTGSGTMTYSQLSDTLQGDLVYYDSTFSATAVSLHEVLGQPLSGHVRTREWAVGFGQIFHREVWSGGTTIGYSLIWANKGGNTYGTPYVLVGVEESLSDASRIKLFPNPSAGHFFVTLSENPNGLGKTTSWEAVNLMGESLRTGTLQNGKSTLDFSDFPPGMYLLRFKEGQKSITKRILIQ